MNFLKTTRYFGLFVLLWTSAVRAAAATPAVPDSAALERVYVDSVNASFHYQTGRVSLPGRLGYIDVPAGMRFLDSAQAQYVLERLWGNPPDNTPLGLLLPTTMGPATDDSWAFMVTYEEMGYVDDGDADNIDYDALLEEMRHDTRLENATRAADGYDPIEVLGWASPPFYDQKHHVLHWAKLLRFGPSGATAHHTLNYDVRVLGRKGVLRLMAISGKGQLPEIKTAIPTLIARTHFADGLQYEDYAPDVDDIAAYSLGGLVAGKVLAKVGFFALIIKFWKVILISGASAWAMVRRWLAGRQG